MEILHKGEVKTDKKLIGTCATCRTVVRFLESEAYVKYPRPYIHCPVCSHQSILGETSLKDEAA
jgi:hypothetical protein